MKKFTFTLAGLFALLAVNAQAHVNTPRLTNKIAMTTGQKIFVETTIALESTLSPGMGLTNNSSTQNLLEVKGSTDKGYTVTNTLTKLKMEMDMMGQPTNYDSEKKEDQETEIGKALSGKLNKPEDVLIDNNTGKDITEKKADIKKDADPADPTNGMLSMFANSNSESAVTAAFELVPQGKAIGDSWADSSIEKDAKTKRTYTLKSISENTATIHLEMVTDATNTIDFQGMAMEYSSSTKTSGDIITDITTGLVKQRTSQSDISGSVQVMGQAMPITAKVSTTTIFK